MTEKEKAKVEALPEALRQTAELYLAKGLSELPEKPETGKWYRNTPDNCVCANNEPYHGCFKLGSENKLAIMFCGGGVSINEYTAARPHSFTDAPGAEKFYANDVFIVADAAAGSGLFKNIDENPFRDWSMMYVPYATGDFHAGTNEYPYVSTSGKQEILYHHGYKNYVDLLTRVKKYIPNPEKILVTGYSAGGFGTALLTCDVMDNFPQCNDVTCLVDSALLIFDGWQKTAKEVWKAPKVIYERLTGNNLVLDSLKALHNKQGSRVKIMFSCSLRDADLSVYQNYIDIGKLIPTEEGGERVKANLRKMCAELQKAIPDVGLFLFDKLDEGTFKGIGNLTQHCMISSLSVFSLTTDGKPAIEWVFNGVNGKTERLGLNLLN